MILVTGATGFVGRRVVAALRGRELSVRCFVRDRDGAASLESLGCDLAVGDVTDAESVAAAAEGCGAVVHLVSIIAGRPEDYDRIMVDGTWNVIDAAQKAGADRLVLMSALGASEETKELVPYYAAKWAMEQAVREAGLEHVILRPSFIFGPGGGSLSQFASLTRYLPLTPVAGPGTQRIQPIYVDDVAEFVARAIDLPEAANRTFELGGPETLSWNEFWDRLAAALGKRRAKLHLPMSLVRAQAAVLERLPRTPVTVTRDQLTMLEAGDNTCDERPAAELFGIELTPLDEQLRRSLG
jgi:NADH dehydrogenase